MIKHLAILIAVISMLAAAFPACSQGTAGQVKDITQKIQKAAQAEMEILDRDSSAAAAGLSKTGLSGTEARRVLNELVSRHSYIVDVAATNTAGVMVTLAPDSYVQFEGTDVSRQDVSVEYNKVKKAMLSQVFKAVEGFYAVILVWPVISGGKELGSMSVLFKPETMFESFVSPAIKGKSMSTMVMQQDGPTLYDTDKSQIGKNLFTDPMYQPYAELQALGKKVAANTEGTGSYSFPASGGGPAVKKYAFWVSLGLHDTAWRLISYWSE